MRASDRGRGMGMIRRQKIGGATLLRSRQPAGKLLLAVPKLRG